MHPPGEMKYLKQSRSFTVSKSYFLQPPPPKKSANSNDKKSRNTNTFSLPSLLPLGVYFTRNDKGQAIENVGIENHYVTFLGMDSSSEQDIKTDKVDVSVSSASTEHLCGEDLYKATLTQKQNGKYIVLFSECVVKGPRKDYTVETEYTYQSTPVNS
ncbi:hypothetical protein AAMO2058_001240700 [Amorphochlora amoebiformis]